MIRRLLVANRGEIASRVFRTCRRLGIETVAVHSDADAALPFVRQADFAVRLPGDTPTETYLAIGTVIDAARRSGADAVHPGYGFLAENVKFAAAVEDAGLTWVGPEPRSIELMGSKIEAKRLVRDVGVPVLEAPVEPTAADLPLLVKASAGGGGRGMRIVRDLDALATEIAAAEAEAASAFGDGTVFVEPYVENGRHVEVQVVGDGRGEVLVLGERDCSVQRRHQKLVEESPAPGLAADTRTALHEAARTVAAAIDYRGAGTVEFLYDTATDRFWFLEMNTRLQVEHPVTELTHGVDLVELQLDVAEGRGFEARSARTSTTGGSARTSTTGSTSTTGPEGHAVEVRLYAEDPAAGHQPQSGRLTRFEIPEEPGIRVDAGYETGSVVSTHYDAMLAKVICHAPTREQAVRRLAGVLSRARIHGVRTNRDQLIAILRDERFLAGEVSTSLLADLTRRADSTRGREAGDGTRGAAVAAALAIAETDRAARPVQRGIPVGWRNVVGQPHLTELEDSTGATIEVRWWGTRDGYRVEGYDMLAAGPTEVTLAEDGVATTYEVAVHRDRVEVDSPHGHTALVRVPRFTDPADEVPGGSLLAPMPGTVVSVAVEVGQRVEAGERVLVLEAMKMQHTVSAPGAGTVTEIDVQPGTQVAAGDVLAVVSTDTTEETA